MRGAASRGQSRRGRTVGERRSLYTRVLNRCRDPRQPGFEMGLTSSPHAFKSLRFRSSVDTFDPGAKGVKMSFQRKRAEVVEITAMEDVFFALNSTGLCGAFDRATDRKLCVLNVEKDEVIRSLFANRTSRSIIAVSVFKRDNFSTLKCRAIPLDYVRRGKPDLGFELFESECLSWPGFVELDDVNHLVLTFCSKKHQYGVWDLKNYDLLYMLPIKDISEIKISPGIMLLVHSRVPESTHLTVTVVDIFTGKTLSSFRLMIHRQKKIEFVEQFNEKLLFKQEGCDLNIFDIKTRKLHVVPGARFPTPQAFVFLYAKDKFLTFLNGTVCVWNFEGKRVADFEDHKLFFQDCSPNNIFISQDQQVLISYCRDSSGIHGTSTTSDGSINISRIADGKLLCKLLKDGLPPSRAQDALQNISAIHYDEERGEMFTGSLEGHVSIWTS